MKKKNNKYQQYHYFNILMEDGGIYFKTLIFLDQRVARSKKEIMSYIKKKRYIYIYTSFKEGNKTNLMQIDTKNIYFIENYKPSYLY